MERNPPEMENLTPDPLIQEGLKLAQQLTAGEITDQQFAIRYAETIKKTKAIDPMTDLHSKTWMEEELKTAISHARRHNEPLSVLFIDGDHFKAINDKMSHADGDTAIKAMAEGIKRGAKRPTDLKTRLQEGESLQTGRDGGDEFVIILEGMDLYQASELAREIQMHITGSVSEFLPDYEKIFGHRFTASIGMAQYDPTIDQDGTSLLKRADQHLIQVREEQGRNRRS